MNNDVDFQEIILDFPEHFLRWLVPLAEKLWGPICKVAFPRQSMPQGLLRRPGRELDFPVRYTFARRRTLIVLIAHCGSKSVFNIHQVAHDTLEAIEAFAGTAVIPVVIFTDDTKWRKDVDRQLQNQWFTEACLNFRYHKVKLKEITVNSIQESHNPVLHILTPLLDFPPEQRMFRTAQAYLKLRELVEEDQFCKYADYIDHYAQLTADELERLETELTYQEGGPMLRDYLEEKGQLKEKNETAQRLLKMGVLSQEQIAEATQLSVDQLRHIQSQHKI